MKKINKSLKYIMLIVAVIITIYPFYWMMYAGTFSPVELRSFTFSLLPGNQLLENLKEVFSIVDFPTVMFNTIFVSLVGTLLSVIVNMLMGYALVMYEFRMKQKIFGLFMTSMFLTGVTSMIASFKIIQILGLYNSLWAIILPGVFSVYNTFLIRQSLADFPYDIIESGRIDGCNEFAIFRRLVVPNVKAIVVTVALITFMGYWSGYLWNLIVVTDMNNYTIQVALASIYPSAAPSTYAHLKILAAFISILPILILFLFTQKFFISSLTGSVKG